MSDGRLVTLRCPRCGATATVFAYEGCPSCDWPAAELTDDDAEPEAAPPAELTDEDQRELDVDERFHVLKDAGLI